MDTVARTTRFLDADMFLRTDQLEFGNAWRYELVRGTIIAHAAPSPEHGVILSNLAVALHPHLRDHPQCGSEIGSGAASKYEPRNTARIPDAMIRCGKNPRVLFDVVSPSELQHKRQRDQRRADLQAVEGVQEIIEIYQDEMLAHIYRRREMGWVFEWMAGPQAELVLASVGITLPLAALYERVPLEEQ